MARLLRSIACGPVDTGPGPRPAPYALWAVDVDGKLWCGIVAPWGIMAWTQIDGPPDTPSRPERTE